MKLGRPSLGRARLRPPCLPQPHLPPRWAGCDGDGPSGLRGARVLRGKKHQRRSRRTCSAARPAQTGPQARAPHSRGPEGTGRCRGCPHCARALPPHERPGHTTALGKGPSPRRRQARRQQLSRGHTHREGTPLPRRFWTLALQTHPQAYQHEPRVHRSVPTRQSVWALPPPPGQGHMGHPTSGHVGLDKGRPSGICECPCGWWPFRSCICALPRGGWWLWRSREAEPTPRCLVWNPDLPSRAAAQQRTVDALGPRGRGLRQPGSAHLPQRYQVGQAPGKQPGC